MNNGWIKLHRKVLENPLCRKPHWGWLWVVLLLKANHDGEEFIWNGEKTALKRGQFITGRKKLSDETGIPESTIEDILRYLESQQQIQQQKTTKYRVITILNYEKYQNGDSKPDNRATTEQQQSDTNKNYNNYKKDKKKNKTAVAEVENISKFSKEGADVIKLFELINPACSNYYSRPPQRQAADDLIKSFGFEKVMFVIQKTLPRTNGLEFFPTITTPLQLREKWAELETAIRRHQNKIIKKSNVIFS